MLKWFFPPTDSFTPPTIIFKILIQLHSYKINSTHTHIYMCLVVSLVRFWHTLKWSYIKLCGMEPLHKEGECMYQCYCGGL
jgi:hypothetical protein